MTKQTTRRLLPPTYLCMAIAAMFAVHFLVPIARILSLPLTLAGLAPLAAGVALNLAADRVFKERGTTVKPFERSTALVTTGVFALSRNPMYLGMVLILLGVAVLLGTATPFAVVGLFALWLDVRFIRAEERMLAETFGEDWLSYRSRVRRWL
ncbi:MAG: methyltransferase family protein [Bradyrhizobium sp.]